MNWRGKRQSSHPTVEGIKRYIRDHGLRPGDALPSETAICEELGCSRSSVRESMRTLASLDIVEVRHGYGTYVSGMSLAPLVNGMVLRLVLDPDQALCNLMHVVDTRIALDLSVAEELAEIHRGQDLSELYGLVESMRQAHARGETFASSDQAFHRRLLQDLKNPLIKELSDAFWQIHTEVVPLLEVSAPADIDATIDAHESMLKALHDGDAETYRQIVHDHYGPLRRAIGRQQQINASEEADGVTSTTR